MTSKEIDLNFNKDIKILANSLNKVSPEERKYIIELFAKVLETYVENKVEKEIESFLYKFL